MDPVPDWSWSQVKRTCPGLRGGAEYPGTPQEPSTPTVQTKAVLWIGIRIRMDSELLPGSESENIVPDPAKNERADFIS